jgi:low affinity Fe/Cu permease
MNARAGFLRLSESAVAFCGHRLVLASVFCAAIVWCAAGAWLSFPTKWLLLSNTLLMIAVLLILFLMQHSQNRDMLALQVKADELIRANENAANLLIGAEKRESHEIEEMARDRQEDV